ncbi:MAG: hypothetical protein M1820_010793 [Bogoriella megaspora]|nr:MAG: hypothetical protein M1820_010793 [Bogoriella megaspora]
MLFLYLLSVIFLLLLRYSYVEAAIDRESIVRSFNVHRTASSNSTPLQVGNGDFAFGADVTGLQTFLPYGILSTWGWHNSSLPTTPGQTSPADFTGLDWLTHGRLVNYEQPNPAEADISQWMIGNPQRMNLGRIGLSFNGEDVVEADLSNARQQLDLYNGTMFSSFVFNGSAVTVKTFADPNSTTIGVEVESDLIRSGNLGIFFDYPYMTYTNKFEAPFVGIWNATANHTTSLQQSGQTARIQHDLDSTTYFTTIHWSGNSSISGPLPSTHRYTLKPTAGSPFSLSFTASYHYNPDAVMAPYYSPQGQGTRVNTDITSIKSASAAWWQEFWKSGSFVSITSGDSANATELQRRTVLSLYLLAVNEAGFDPPQESGLTNNGWYGKFHAEMFLWHLGPWARWGKWSLLDRSIPGVYERFLPSSIQRAQKQGYDGARWGKESDPTGRSAPGEINSLLIWQQPHPMTFAEYEYRAFPSNSTLGKWNEIISEAADFMVSYAFWNESTGVYDLGPPMYPVSENTDPNATRNPTFELAYWRLGLNIASDWQRRQGKPVPAQWSHVAENLAPLPVQNNSYVIYEGIENMWNNETYDEDHPSMLGIYGWLPPPTSGFNLSTMQNTRDLVYETWNFTYSYGWDFPLLAMNAARLGDVDKAIDFLLDPTFAFDDAGYPIGGARVPTPYFPGSASLLWAVALLAGGWDGSEGPHWPEGWVVESEGFSPSL